MSQMLIPTLLCLSLVASVNAQSTDTLQYVRQWPVSAGGNDHYYAILSPVTSIDSARAIAENLTFNGRQGYLATITSAEENDFILNVIVDDTLPPVPTDQYYLGAGLDCSSGPCVFRWLTDSLGDYWWYDNWAADQPTGDGGIVGIRGDSYGAGFGQWNDFGSFGQPEYINCRAIIEFGLPVIEDTLIDVRQWAIADGGNDHWYGILVLPNTREKHIEMIESMSYDGEPGYLASILSAEENQFVADLIADHPDPQPYAEDQFYLGIAPDHKWTSGEARWYNHGNFRDYYGGGGMLGLTHGADWGNWWRLAGTVRSFAVVEFGEPFIPEEDTLIDVRQWTVAEGGNDHWYGIMALPLDFAQADSLAQTLTHNSEPGYLASINSQAEDAFITTLINDHPQQVSDVDRFQVGGMLEENGVWAWTSGEAFLYQGWPWVPDKSALLYVLMLVGPSGGEQVGEWDFRSPTYRCWSVVEFGPTGVSPVDTSGFVGARIWDVESGGNGHVYAVIPIDQSWQQHSDLAPELYYFQDQGYLATIQWAEENDFVLSLISDFSALVPGEDQFFVGGRETGIEFDWTNNEYIYYENWAPGEPASNGAVMVMDGVSQGATAGQWRAIPEDDGGSPTARWAVVEFGQVPCCIGATGNVNGDPEDEVNLGDLTFLVNMIFVWFHDWPCRMEADVTFSYGCDVTLSDLTALLNSLFVTFEPLPPCRVSCY